MELYGIQKILDICGLPEIKTQARVHYEGSIDKAGGNADWDWWLYQDKNGEWVIFDVDGPGCIYNFVQHRYISSEEAVFYFYFDGEETPRFTIAAHEFGEKYPFVEPLASKYIGPVDKGRGPIRVVRSFVPLPFKKSCKITSNVRLEGYDRSKGDGGWGHVIYHSYTSGGDIATFTGDEDYAPLIELWKKTGSRLFDKPDLLIEKKYNISLPAGARIELFSMNGAGCARMLRLMFSSFTPAQLHDIWIRITWDGHMQADAYCPIGAFFSNEIGAHSVRYLLTGMAADGYFYNYFPMPFWEGASICLENKGAKDAVLDFAEWGLSDKVFDKASNGYFRSSAYYERKSTPGADSIIGVLTGRGKLVSSLVTAYAEKPGAVSCEGDVRIYIDGAATPSVESDGSESYACYGWGFPTPPETHPSGGYDGLPDNPWSMTRLAIGDCCPFASELRFGIESGGNNDQMLEHSGVLLYYGMDDPAWAPTDILQIGDEESRLSHGYEAHGDETLEPLTAYFEGDDDHIAISETVSRFTGHSVFKVTIFKDNAGVVLRRMSDQANGRQHARVIVDGMEVTERKWMYADRNPIKRWLEDEFIIPAAYTAGKTTLSLRIEPIAHDGGKPVWNEAKYHVFSLLP